MESLLSPPSRAPVDDLYLERLQAFLDKSLGEIQAFSEREGRDVDETRRYVAEWHCRHLFNSAEAPSREASEGGDDNPSHAAYSILHDTSQALEILHSISGIHSFILAVDPAIQRRVLLPGPGFLGGTEIGREFWQGMRGGGDAGAKSFKAYCAKSRPDPSARVSGAVSAGVLKAELYDRMRTALRAATGNRKAEMKWSNHDRLANYGVRVLGWPETVPHKNPSALSVTEMRSLLEALRTGSLRFVPAGPEGDRLPSAVGGSSREDAAAEHALAWVYDDALGANVGDDGGLPGLPGLTGHPPSS